jgi:hypothetical protein
MRCPPNRDPECLDNSMSIKTVCPHDGYAHVNSVLTLAESSFQAYQKICKGRVKKLEVKQLLTNL